MPIIRQLYLRDKKIKTVGQYIQQYYQDHSGKLQTLYPGLTYRRLLQEYLAFGRLGEEEIFVRPFSEFFNKLEEGEPLEYINHNSFFFEHNFYVNHNVLIPRSETELLVEMAINYINKSKNIQKICEIGVGSGAIILSILTKIDRSLHAIASDISEEALDIARKNFFRLKNCMHPESTLELRVGDRLYEQTDKFDLIISNPPYIKKKLDINKVHEQVLKFEPHCALFIEDEKYNDWFSTLFEQVNSCLNEQGMFMMEGHEDHLSELAAIAKASFPFVKLSKDFSGQTRFLQAAKRDFNG